MTVNEHVAPQSLEAEVCLIGAMLIDSEAVLNARSLLSPEQFYRQQLRSIFEAVCSVADAGGAEAVDLVTVVERLRGEDKLEEVGGSTFLTQCIEQLSSSAMAPAYCRIIADAAIKRDMIRVADGTIEACYNGRSASGVLDDVDAAVKRLRARTRFGPIDGMTHVAEIAGPALEELERWQAARRNWRAAFAITGTALDDTMLGLKPSDLSVIKGIRSHGKTAFGVQVVDLLIAKSKPAVFVTADMAKEEMFWRFVQRRAGVTIYDRFSSQMSESRWSDLYVATATLNALPLRIQYESTAEITRVLAALEAEFVASPAELVVFDYLQRLSHRQAETKEREVSYIANECKAFAVRHRCHVMLLAQINEHGEARWSREVEDAADVVVRIKKEMSGASRGELILEKQRNGRTGSVEFSWDGTRQVFS